MNLNKYNLSWVQIHGERNNMIQMTINKFLNIFIIISRTFFRKKTIDSIENEFDCVSIMAFTMGERWHLALCKRFLRDTTHT